jgi:hypothetical protein
VAAALAVAQRAADRGEKSQRMFRASRPGGEPDTLQPMQVRLRSFLCTSLTLLHVCKAQHVAVCVPSVWAACVIAVRGVHMTAGAAHACVPLQARVR